MAMIKAAGFEVEIDRTIGDNRWYINMLREVKNAYVVAEVVVGQAKIEDLVCQLIAELGLTKRIQKALKPLLVDAVHAQAPS
jgi:hypothetical protein